MEKELRKALIRNELILFYQPQVDLRSGRIVGTEALIRWKHPERGMVSAQDIIPLAEDTGLIVPLGEWILDAACTQNKAWQDMGYDPMVVSVNLSPSQFVKSNLIKLVKKVLEQTGLDPCYLQLEITESRKMDVDRDLAILEKLKEFGVYLGIDDFGKGYSSLVYLKEFPIDTLKIDQSFVHDCTVHIKDAEIVKMIISMAHSLGLNVIAEGVETKQHLDFLKQHLCNAAQGYLFSKPLPADELERMFCENTRHYGIRLDYPLF
ncbi:putative bifunctional diguanylate cyclase/phosphodiesterase [Paenibacillus sp. PvR148]